MKLKDPLKDRQVNDTPLPPSKRLPSKHVWNQKDEVQWKIIREFQEKQGFLQKTDVLKILKKQNEPNVLKVSDPINIVGDLHGQYHDLLTVFRLGGKILKDNNKYLFLGDYVDRGYFSCEIVILLFSMKIQFPDRIYLLRGNHETREMAHTFNFCEEVYKKYDQEVFQEIMRVFDALPLAAIINDKFLAVHGGLSPELQTIDNINKIQRFKEVPTSGIFCDLVWSDPVSNKTGSQNNLFQTNKDRNCSYYFGKKAVKKFLKQNNLHSIIRAHEVQFEGFKLHNWSNVKQKLPLVITIFSAPNYCDRYMNKGAIIKLQNNTINIEQYHYKNSPFYLPGFQNLFEYSIPFISKDFMFFIGRLTKYTQKVDGDDISNTQLQQVIEDLNKDPNWKQKVEQFQKLYEQKEINLNNEKKVLLEESKKQACEVEKIAEEQRREKFKKTLTLDKKHEARAKLAQIIFNKYNFSLINLKLFINEINQYREIIARPLRNF